MNSADQTAVAAELEASFATWATSFVLGELQALPGLFWLGWPVTGAAATTMVKQVITILTKSVVVRAMLAVQAEQKSYRAADYLAARANRRGLPPTATKDEHARAETQELVSFVDLVVLK